MIRVVRRAGASHLTHSCEHRFMPNTCFPLDRHFGVCQAEGARALPLITTRAPLWAPLQHPLWAPAAEGPARARAALPGPRRDLSLSFPCPFAVVSHRCWTARRAPGLHATR